MKIKTSKFDPVNYLETDTTIQAFLNSANETNDAEYIIQALRVAIRAQGMLKISQKTGLNRSNLYHSFYQDGKNPRIMTVSKLANSLGYRIALIPTQNPETKAAP